MFDYSYLVELLSPKRSADDEIEVFLDRFSERYRRIIDAGCGLSIPDNPMGQPRLGALESINLRDLSVDPEKVVMNLNTFHTKNELDGLLQRAAEAKIKYILVVRGDGGPLLSKLDSKSIGGSGVTDQVRAVHALDELTAYVVGGESDKIMLKTTDAFIQIILFFPTRLRRMSLGLRCKQESVL